MAKIINGQAVDAFGRTRVSVTHHRVDSQFTYDKQSFLFDEIVAGTGTATHSADLRAVYLSTGGNGDGAAAALRQHFYNPYTPGNSQLIYITGCMNPDGVVFTNAEVEFGYGDLLNGIGFRYSAAGAQVFLRSAISGTPVDLTVVNQADWDNPVKDIDWTKSQIFGFDFQSLAVGRIRFYIDRGGAPMQVCEIKNDNLRTGPYWQMASLPCYWAVKNNGVETVTARALAICTTVKSEGGLDLFDMPGYPFGADGGTAKTVSTTLIPLMSMRVATTFKSRVNRMLVLPKELEAFSSAQPVRIELLLNATLTGASWAAAHAESGVEIDIAATALSGGRRIGAPLLVAGQQRGNVTGRDLSGRVPLSLNAAGTVGDILTAAAVRIGSVNSDVSASLGWDEIR